MKIFILIALVVPLCCAGTLVGVTQAGDNKQQQPNYGEHQEPGHHHHHHQQHEQHHAYGQQQQQQKPNWEYEYVAPNVDKGVLTHVTLHRTPTRTVPVISPVIEQQPLKPQHVGVQISHVSPGPEHQPHVGVHVSHVAGNEQGVEHVSQQYIQPHKSHESNQQHHYQVQEQYPQQSSGVVAVQYLPQHISQPHELQSQFGHAVHLVTVPVVQIPNQQVRHVEAHNLQHIVPTHEQQQHSQQQQQQSNIVSHIVVPLSGHGGVFGVHAEPVGQHQQQAYPSHVAFGGQQYPQGIPQVGNVQPQGGHYVVQHPIGVPASVSYASEVQRKTAADEPQKSHIEQHAQAEHVQSQQHAYESQEHYVAGHSQPAEGVYVPQVPMVSHVAILGHITSAAGPHYQQVQPQPQQQQQQQATHAPHINIDHQHKQN